MEKQVNKKILVMLLTLGGFLITINQSILTVTLSHFREVFDVSTSAVQWLTTGFMLISGVIIPLMAYLMKRFTTKQLFFSAMMSLLVGVLISGVAPNFAILLIGRLITSISAAIIMPLAMSIISVLYPKEKRGTIMGIVGLAVIFGAALAPTLSGIILNELSWRWIFLGMIPFALITILLGMRYLVNVSETEAAKLDVPSVIYSTVGLTALLYGFTIAGGLGWGNVYVIGLVLLSIIFITLFTVRQSRLEEPLLNLTIFKYKQYTLVIIIMFLVTMITYADMIILPIYLAEGRNFTPIDAGLLLLPGALANAILSPFTGKLLDKLGNRPVFIIGLVIIIPCLWVATDLTETTTFLFLVIRSLFLRIGFSFLMMPLMTASLNVLPERLTDHGSAMTNTLRQLSAAIGTAVIITIYTAHTQRYNDELISTMDAHGHIEDIGKYALIMGSDDAYFYMTIAAIISLILALFLPSKNKAEKLES